MFRLFCYHTCFYTPNKILVSPEEFAVFVQSYPASDACCALPAEAEPCSQGHTLHLGKGKAEVLQGKHSSFPHRSILLLISSQEQNYRQGALRQVQGKAPALVTALALEHFSCSERAASFCSSSAATGAWGLFVPRKQEPVPSPGYWHLHLPIAAITKSPC